MKKVNVQILGSLGLLLLSSCETTGDPYQGGYLGWSETKSNQRQNVMRSDLSGLHETGSELVAERDQLQGEINRLNEQRRRAQQRRDAAAIARIDSEIRSKEARLAALLEVL
jgi:hypothetical protein